VVERFAAVGATEGSAGRIWLAGPLLAVDGRGVSATRDWTTIVRDSDFNYERGAVEAVRSWVERQVEKYAEAREFAGRQQGCCSFRNCRSAIRRSTVG